MNGGPSLLLFQLTSHTRSYCRQPRRPAFHLNSCWQASSPLHSPPILLQRLLPHVHCILPTTEKSLPMVSTSTLLNCSICPKHPTFSDTSHLLTHVSSKGHLSFLHKLQVRSHQEISAGHQLAAYNQWFLQHDLSRLLSERMLHKEAKKANKRRETTLPQTKANQETPEHREPASSPGRLPGDAFATQAFAIDPSLDATPLARRSRPVRLTHRNAFRPDDESDFEPIVVKKTQRYAIPKPLSK